MVPPKGDRGSAEAGRTHAAEPRSTRSRTPEGAGRTVVFQSEEPKP
ncbi:putative protein OS=Streptomyces griseomycini OX=66895 GN=FHS37_004580 PE=4 SV=1 [Streptomyces griseomycini]|uniref:Uncharacterized protein n=1 Tax=Streptomyces griseomycini TaxID=66895 RepID=A0A7W7M250_9ACTN|nr:hypothetical protein [Streptomyces griseomycini]